MSLSFGAYPVMTLVIEMVIISGKELWLIDYAAFIAVRALNKILGLVP